MLLYDILESILVQLRIKYISGKCNHLHFCFLINNSACNGFNDADNVYKTTTHKQNMEAPLEKSNCRVGVYLEC